MVICNLSGFFCDRDSVPIFLNAETEVKRLAQIRFVVNPQAPRSQQHLPGSPLLPRGAYLSEDICSNYHK